MELFIIIFLALFIIIINIVYTQYQKDLYERAHKPKENALYTCYNGDYKGQTHDIKDWRKIAIELARTTKNSRINAIAKHGTDEDVIGLLYFNFGVELFDNEINM